MSLAKKKNDFVEYREQYRNHLMSMIFFFGKLIYCFILCSSISSGEQILNQLDQVVGSKMENNDI